jgi:hypothetical protein
MGTVRLLHEALMVLNPLLFSRLFYWGSALPGSETCVTRPALRLQTLTIVVAVLVAERLAPSREMMDLSAGSLNRASYFEAERLLRAEAGSLVDANKRAEGVVKLCVLRVQSDY